jgi:EF hand
MRLLAFILITGLVATSALAQTAPAPAAPAPAQSAAGQRLMAADADKDGKWSKDEWLAAGRKEMGFNLIDADKDGFVSRAELAEGMKRMRAMGMAPPQ